MPTMEEDRKKGGLKMGERGRNSICLKTCVVHYMLQMNLFEVCNVNGFPLASMILCVLQV